ncbi:hypothetical protein [Nocardia xishanensis]
MPNTDSRAARTDLAFGVTSRNAVDAVVALAHRHRTRLMLIASRSQIERRPPGGYVEGWTSGQLVDYVREHDREGTVVVCRDHGGPWQHSTEVAAELAEPEAMASCMRSFHEDIDAGVGVLHIDTSREVNQSASSNTAVRRLIDVYGQCHEYASTGGHTVGFEIGIEEQAAATGDPIEFREFLRDVLGRLSAESLPLPTFVVGQTGTKVVEMGNRGALVHDPVEVGLAVRELSKICHSVGTRLKAHNVDYLEDKALHTLLDSGVDALNVAPEFGVAETKAFLRLLTAMRLPKLRDEFLEMAYTNGSWRKWLAPQSTLSTVERCVLAGHYTFGTAAFKELEAKVQRACGPHDIRVHAYLRSAVEVAMTRYLRAVGQRIREREAIGWHR